jgi:hypothetical protein
MAACICGGLKEHQGLGSYDTFVCFMTHLFALVDVLPSEHPKKKRWPFQWQFGKYNNRSWVDI